ncbi:uncharacterized protein LOC124681231 [Lolium rigidum]|uniref:uncharacterized protein LOC124681231 n=1 Tax=Lolium rigidum TaxID=89674 RepID=UPI001F5D041F|nr:uncharacterized protein LOC124681231 [Lolium rigidum]
MARLSTANTIVRVDQAVSASSARPRPSSPDSPLYFSQTEHPESPQAARIFARKFAVPASSRDKFATEPFSSVNTFTGKFSGERFPANYCTSTSQYSPSISCCQADHPCLLHRCQGSSKPRRHQTPTICVHCLDCQECFCDECTNPSPHHQGHYSD